MQTEPIGALSRAEATPSKSPAPPAPESSFRARLAEAATRGSKAATAALEHETGPEALGARGGARGPHGSGPAGGGSIEIESPKAGGGRPRPRQNGADDAERPPELAPFAAPPAVLSPPPTGAAAVSPAGAGQAELTALVERFLTSVRVGRLPDGSSVLRLRVDGRGRGDVEVELRGTAAGLVAHVDAADGDRRRASEWAERLEAALRARGLDVGPVEVG